MVSRRRLWIPCPSRKPWSSVGHRGGRLRTFQHQHADNRTGGVGRGRPQVVPSTESSSNLTEDIEDSSNTLSPHHAKLFDALVQDSRHRNRSPTSAIHSATETIKRLTRVLKSRVIYKRSHSRFRRSAAGLATWNAIIFLGNLVQTTLTGSYLTDILRATDFPVR